MGWDCRFNACVLLQLRGKGLTCAFAGVFGRFWGVLCGNRWGIFVGFSRFGRTWGAFVGGLVFRPELRWKERRMGTGGSWGELEWVPLETWFRGDLGL